MGKNKGKGKGKGKIDAVAELERVSNELWMMTDEVIKDVDRAQNLQTRLDRLTRTIDSIAVEMKRQRGGGND